jgi:hypothetical protein
MQVSVVHALLSLQLTVLVVSHSPVIGLTDLGGAQVAVVAVSWAAAHCAWAAGSDRGRDEQATQERGGERRRSTHVVPPSEGTVLPRARLGNPYSSVR